MTKNTEKTQSSFNQDIPKFAQKGEDLPRRAIYKTLRQMWFDQTGLTNKELAVVLKVTPQSCSTMATGGDKRLPPWWAIMKLCWLTDTQLELSPSGVDIVQKPQQAEG